MTDLQVIDYYNRCNSLWKQFNFQNIYLEFFRSEFRVNRLKTKDSTSETLYVCTDIKELYGFLIGYSFLTNPDQHLDN